MTKLEILEKFFERLDKAEKSHPTLGDLGAETMSALIRARDGIAHLTPRAPDAGESAASTSFLQSSAESASDGNTPPAHLRVIQSVRRHAEKVGNMANYQATEKMDAHNITIGQEIYFAESFGFRAGDILTIYDRNGVKWHEVKMKNATTGIYTKQFVKIDNSAHKAAMRKAMETVGW